MRRIASIWLRVFVAVNFLTGAIGVPLYAHVCASMGTRALISSCEMHEDASEATPEPVVVEAPAVSSCCSGEATHEVATAVAPVVAAATPVVVDRVQSGDCCSDVDVTMQVTDSFTAVTDGHGVLPLGSAGVLALPGVPVVLQPAVVSFFLFEFSPPPHSAEILSTTVLLI